MRGSPIRCHPRSPIVCNLRIVNPAINIIIVGRSREERDPAIIRAHGASLLERDGRPIGIDQDPANLPVELDHDAVVHVRGPVGIAVAVDCDGAGARDVGEADRGPGPGQAVGEPADVYPALAGVVVDHAVAEVVVAGAGRARAGLVGDGVADVGFRVADGEPALVDLAVDEEGAAGAGPVYGAGVGEDVVADVGAVFIGCAEFVGL
jgi:hypothetical protein